MGFRTGAFTKVWEVTPLSDTCTKLRVSISRKNKQTDEYEQEFSGFVMVVGTGASQEAAKLSPGDKIRLGDVDVTTRYDKPHNVTYTNFKVYSFELDDDRAPSAAGKSSSARSLDEGYDGDDSALPF
jgi:hypothetical protein